MEKIPSITDYLPLRLKKAAEEMDNKLKKRVDEIRLRRNGAFSVFAGGKNLFPNAVGHPVPPDKAITVSSEEFDECIFLLCKGSMYSFDDTIKRGYIPIPYGRAGVCGEAVTENGIVKRVRKINSLSLRVHRNVSGYGKKVLDIYKEKGLMGTLIYSPPAMGKTTLLRSVALMLANGEGMPPVKVGIADERNEIMLPNVSAGLADTVSGCPKHIGAEILTRTMSPQVIVCDEITADDTDTLLRSTGTGVYLICSCHGHTKADLNTKPHVKHLLDTGCFGLLVKLHRENGRYGYGTELI